MIHNFKNLSDYNLFVNPKNTLIEKALFVNLNEIVVFFYQNINFKDIKLYSINYENNFNLLVENNFEIFYQDRKITLKGNFTFTKNYKIKIDNDESYVILDPLINEILDSYFDISSEENFGLSVIGNVCKFKLWSPPAVKVEIIFFDKNQNQILTDKTFSAKRKDKGIWEFETNKKEILYSETEFIYYRYLIYAYGKTTQALDPYSKSMAVFNSETDEIGKSALINTNSEKANPENFVNEYSNFKYIKDETDVVFYEINVRDFTIQPGIVAENIAGTFSGFSQKIDYLVDLGITHVQLMPVNKCYTVNEADRKFTGKAAEKSNYNWGYDPLNYFTPEGKYCQNPENPFVRIKEFKTLIKNLHEKGIGVILDVVFNHSYIVETFENIAPACYFRHNQNGEISGHTGAGPSLESRRKSVRKFIIDVLKYFVKEYHIDGFRFDLMSFHDHETMRQIRQEVGKEYNPKNIYELILHGEAWNFTDIEENSAFTKNNFPEEDLHVSVFNDSFRDSSTGNGEFKGFVQGNQFEASRMSTGIIGAFKNFDTDFLPFNTDIFFDSYNLFANKVADCINYLSIHDGHTLWDKINLTQNDNSLTERLAQMKLAFAILFVSKGKILLHGGDEIMRTKPLSDFDVEVKRTRTSAYVEQEEGVKFFHENSYQSVDFTNMFRWNKLTDENSKYAKDLFNYVKGLIKIRRKFECLRNGDFTDFEFLRNENQNYIETKYNSFKTEKLEEFKIIFKNGPANKRFYLVGEIHKEDANPENNPFYLDFDQFGNSEILFNKQQILNFDLKKWSSTPELNFKLIETPGKWDYLDYAYSPSGNNYICANKINEQNEIVIDLFIKDFKQTEYNNIKPEKYLAYKISTKNTEYDSLCVFINTSETEVIFYNKIFENIEKFVILADNNLSDINQQNIRKSEVKINEGMIIIPSKSLILSAKKKQL